MPGVRTRRKGLAMSSNLRSIVSCVVAGLCLAAGAASAADTTARGKVVLSSDFERESRANVPDGWTMWGAQRYKDPANYTRDLSDPHGGKACFRIHHPAGTAGYVISSPSRAVRPRKGMMYTISFWARTDKPGPSRFGVQAYRSIAPYASAMGPGHVAFDVVKKWKRFSYTYHEGWEFFADQARYLVLDFNVSRDAGAARTLWIDDVSVAEAPSTRDGRLLDPERMEYPKLRHRLRRGDRLAITVDARRRIGQANRMVGGVSFHRVAGWTGLPYDKEGKYVLPRALEQAIRQMRLPMTRFYAVGDEKFSLEESIDKAAAMCRRIGVPLAAVPLEFEVQSAMRSLPPDVWARGVKHSLARRYGFRYWEITNEPYVHHEPMAFPTPESYLSHVRAVSAAVRGAHPDAKIGMSINPRNHLWGQSLLIKAAGCYDWVAPHYYCFIDAYTSDFEDVVLTGNFHVMDLLLRTRQMLRAHNPGREVVQYDTEWGLHSRARDGRRAGHARRNGNVFGTVHRAVRLIYYARENLLAGASSWEMFSTDSTPGMGFFARNSPEQRHMMYWLYYHFNRHVGKWALDIEGTARWHTGKYRGIERNGPLTPVLATLAEGGKTMLFVMANGSWRADAPCSITLRNFPAVKAEGVVLSHDDPDAHPRSARKEDFVTGLPVGLSGGKLTCVLPPHAVVFLRVAAER
jgi:hypothetical protein